MEMDAVVFMRDSLAFTASEPRRLCRPHVLRQELREEPLCIAARLLWPRDGQFPVIATQAQLEVEKRTAFPLRPDDVLDLGSGDTVIGHVEQTAFQPMRAKVLLRQWRIRSSRRPMSAGPRVPPMAAGSAAEISGLRGTGVGAAARCASGLAPPPPPRRGNAQRNGQECLRERQQLIGTDQQSRARSRKPSGYAQQRDSTADCACSAQAQRCFQCCHEVPHLW